MSCNDEHDADVTCYDCMKYQTKVCAEHPQCKDPKLYCKFRPSCMIHFLAKQKDGERDL